MSYLGEFVLTAVHLINKSPTLILGNKTPYEILHTEEVSYDHLRAFGCLAFASNPATSTDKFISRRLPCVTLGYPPDVKGYT